MNPVETPEPAKPKWFSIKDAAQYLDVGEQTVYRWMREGKITYRRIGDSIRFLREDLDTLIEIYPSQKDATKVNKLCPFCHHTELIEGVVQGTGLVYFRPKKTKFWTFRDANIKTHAHMCPRCSAIIWFGDTDKIKPLQGESKESEG